MLSNMISSHVRISYCFYQFVTTQCITELLIAITDGKEIFSWIRNLKFINCEHVIVQYVVLLFFFQLNYNKLYPTSLIKIAEITYAIHHGLSETIEQGIGQKKSKKTRPG